MSVVVTIEGVDKTSSVDFGSLKKTDNLNQQVDNLTFTLKKYGVNTYVPALGDEVVVTKGAVTVFGGVIVKIDERIDAAKVLLYQIQCNDYSQFLKRQLVTERYLQTTVSDIIGDIVSNYTGDGITDDDVVAPLVLESASFNRLTVSECLQKLANALSYVWYVDYEKSIHFFPKNTEMAPFNLTDTSGNYIYDSLEITEDITQLRNSVLVQGGEAESENTRTEFFSGDGERATFALANKFSSLPGVLVGTFSQTVGVEYLDDEGSFDVMWNFNEKYIRFTAGNIPTTGSNNIEVEGLYLFPIVVQVPSPASINEFGTYEFSITDKSIISQEEAIQRALAELAVYKSELYEGSFRTYQDGLRSGQVIEINSTIRDKSINVLIQSVTARMRDPIGTRFEYEIKFATLKSIGIIEYLQAQLLSKEIIVDDQQTLLNLEQFTDLDIEFSDTMSSITTSSGPYVWSNDAGTSSDKLVWGYGTWA